MTNVAQDEKIMRMPIAVYAPFVNQRIKAQNGTFTMFALDMTETQSNENNKLEMYNLYDWQKRICREYPNECKKFLARVHISSFALIDVIEHLKMMGIYKHMIYPELDNISKYINKQVDNYMNKK